MENFADISARVERKGERRACGRGGNEDEIVWRISRRGGEGEGGGGGKKQTRKLVVVVAASITGEKETLLFGERGN